jgi:hypothetical protein
MYIGTMYTFIQVLLFAGVHLVEVHGNERPALVCKMALAEEWQQPNQHQCKCKPKPVSTFDYTIHEYEYRIAKKKSTRNEPSAKNFVVVSSWLDLRIGVKALSNIM